MDGLLSVCSPICQCSWPSCKAGNQTPKVKTDQHVNQLRISLPNQHCASRSDEDYKINMQTYFSFNTVKTVHFLTRVRFPGGNRSSWFHTAEAHPLHGLFWNTTITHPGWVCYSLSSTMKAHSDDLDFWDTKQDCPCLNRMTTGHDFSTHVIRKFCHHGLDERWWPGKSPLGNIDHPQFKTPAWRINDRASIKTVGQQKLYNVCIWGIIFSCSVI